MLWWCAELVCSGGVLWCLVVCVEVGYVVCEVVYAAG